MKHTAGAIKAAEIIMHGRRKIDTAYGEKTWEGLSDLIDRETHAPELLDLLKAAIARVELANAEGNNILSAWLPDAKAIVTKIERGEL